MIKKLTGPFGVILGAAKEFFAPRVCALCREGEAEGETGLCAACLGGVRPITDPMCPVCALPFDGVGPSHPCSLCATRPPAFTRTYACGAFDGPLKDAIHRYKYGDDPPLRVALEALFLRGVTEEFGHASDFSAIVPVPCHPKTLKARGFYLPALLSRRIANHWKLDWKPKALTKTRAEAHMAGVSVRDRKRVVAGLYAHSEKVGGRVLLVDDVVTSTLTVRAAARALKRAGAEEVIVASLARTPAPVRWKL